MTQDDGLGRTANTVTWLLTSISLVAVLLRLVARQMKGNFGIDVSLLIKAALWTFMLMHSVRTRQLYWQW